MAARVLVLNGPNLNMLGLRQPEIYGRVTLSDVEAACVAFGTERGLEVRCAQSNHEGELVTLIQEARETADAIVINAGAYTHTSVAILDALNIFEGLVVELHVSQVFKREPFRHHSYISARADAVMAGFGTTGYELALDYVARRQALPK